MPKGGKRDGAGRKSRAEELGLNDLMDSIGPTEDVLNRLYSLAVGSQEAEEIDPETEKVKIIKATPPNPEAIKLWLGYKFGTPKQSVNVDNHVEVVVSHES